MTKIVQTCLISISLQETFVCPYDKSEVFEKGNFLACKQCRQEFPVQGNFIDFRSKQSIPFNDLSSSGSWYQKYYETLLQKGKPEEFGGFGSVYNSVSEGFVKETLNKLIGLPKKDDYVCDVGAGIGDYSIPIASKCKIIFHCDLDLDAVMLAQKHANEKNIENIFFLACDYFKLPFKENTINLTYGIDVIERGHDQDRTLINEVIRITKNNGIMVFDCHSKERFKFTRVKENVLFTYSKTDIVKFCKDFELENIKIIGTGYLPQIKKWSNFEYRLFNNMGKQLCIPPARWLMINKVIKRSV